MKTLVLVSSLPVVVGTNGRLTLTGKFIEGVKAHARHWPGDLKVVMEPTKAIGDNLDYVEVSPSELPFEVIADGFASNAVAQAIKSASMVMLLLYQKHIGLGRLCRDNNIPCIYTSEFSLRTRLQIVAATTANPVKRLAKFALEVARERSFRNAVKTSSGIQCNGTPTFQAYRHISPDAMRFFDTRMEAELYASDADLDRKFQTRRQIKKVRLAFSGRLIAMKGADHLPAVARKLADSSVPFELTICGDGILSDTLRRQIEEYGLGDRVRLAGTLDFESQLVPFVRDEVDLFVCCHPQGDPSCTYLETMACGTPIVGYDNEAFSGLVGESGAGWLTPSNDPAKLALTIAGITDGELERMSKASLAFARRHTFENEFARRMDHTRKLAGLQGGGDDADDRT